ncbi:MAG: TIM barrel protein [Verrucomicrobia bacterium]|nr:TIM barrel protein [Verrucomicrobiota bacterium]
MNTPPASRLLSRRELLRRTTALTAGALALGPAGRLTAAPAATHGRIKHSIVQWPFEQFGSKWNLDQLCEVAKELGCVSVELVPDKDYPILKRHGLICAIGQIDMNPDPPFVKGFNNPDHWPRVIKATTDAIDAAAAFGFPNVICFTGYSARQPGDPRSKHIAPERGARNCVAGFKQVVGYAEQKGVTSASKCSTAARIPTPMKGHPGYQGDHVDYCLDILRRVSSPRLKLLFDIYHVQVMDGDLVRRIRQSAEFIGHVHTAGNPGRGELDDRQEINFAPVLRALVEVGYRGYVGHEFIPTRDAREGLRQAITVCDV